MPILTSAPACYEHSPSSIASFVDCVGGKVISFERRERRAHARYMVVIPAIVQPLDAGRQPQGKPFNAATRDISAGGIGLVQSQPVTAKFLGVKLTPPNGKGIQLLVKVRRCTPLGTYFDIAGQFITTQGLHCAGAG